MMHPVMLLVISGVLDVANSYTNPHFFEGRSTIVNLFEWKWEDIARECETFLGPKGFGGVQTSPPNENVIIPEKNRPWWERYEPMSYKLITRSGNEVEFANMVKRCNDAKVRIYVDVVINHMSGTWNNHVGTAGSTADFSNSYYPNVPYGSNDFNQPTCNIQSSDYTFSASNVRNCQLDGRKDLNQTSEYVRYTIASYLNKLINHGVAGFRVDSAKHIWPSDLQAIYSRLNDLHTDHDFPENARPYIYQEVIDLGGEAIAREEYTTLASVTEFRYGSELSVCFQGNNALRWLVNWGPEWGLMPSDVALAFIDSNENQRGYGTSGILTHKNSRPYKAAIAFMLAHPYGQPRLVSSFDFTDPEAGPPMDEVGNILSPVIYEDNTCGAGYICEHRWRQMYEMVAFRNQVAGTEITNWWDNSNNQIAFCRGTKGFIAINIEWYNLDQTIQTCLPPGRYCDIISGNKVNNVCEGKTIYVNNDGTAQISIAADDYDAVLAIHAGPESRLDYPGVDDQIAEDGECFCPAYLY